MHVLRGRESACQDRRLGFHPWVGKIPWRWKWQWQPTPVFLPGKSYGQRSLAGYSPRGRRVRHNLATEQQQQQTLPEEKKSDWRCRIAIAKVKGSCQVHQEGFRPF